MSEKSLCSGWESHSVACCLEDLHGFDTWKQFKFGKTQNFTYFQRRSKAQYHVSRLHSIHSLLPLIRWTQRTLFPKMDDGITQFGFTFMAVTPSSVSP